MDRRRVNDTHLLPPGDGFTELADEDHEGLLPTYITTRGALNDAEQANIVAALDRRRPTAEQLLDGLYLRQLHKAMFGDVWAWAGRLRQRETNIGVDPTQIGIRLSALLADVPTWIEHRVYPVDEIAARFHHGLVAIHIFLNGNGRHGRIATDYLLAALDAPEFTWGAGSDAGVDNMRSTYHRALEAATGGDIEPLLRFVRS